MARRDDDGTKYELKIEFSDWMGNRRYLHVRSTEIGMLGRSVSSSNGTPLGVSFMHKLPAEPLEGETADELASRFVNALVVGNESNMPPRVISARRSVPNKGSGDYTIQQVIDAARAAGLIEEEIVNLLSHLPTKSGERSGVLGSAHTTG